MDFKKPNPLDALNAKLSSKHDESLIVKAQVYDGNGNVVNTVVPLSSLESRTEPLHDSLPKELLERGAVLWNRIGRFVKAGEGKDKWIDGFRIEAHPDREMLVWEIVADACDLYFEANPSAKSSRTARSRIIGTMLGVSFGALNVQQYAKIDAKLEAELVRCYNAAVRKNTRASEFNIPEFKLEQNKRGWGFLNKGNI